MYSLNQDVADPDNGTNHGSDSSLYQLSTGKGVNESSCNDPLIVVDKIMSDSDCSRVATSLGFELQSEPQKNNEFR
ncbi:13749_t:CDS:1, partial [Funneliformis geosporum]